MAENENTLVKAMREMKEHNDNAYKNAFVKEMLFSKFYVPLNISPEPENNTIKPGSIISYMSIHNKNTDKKLLITFTSKDEYNKFMAKMPSSHIAIHPYNEVKALVRDKKFDGFIIDPAGENVAITTELMQNIAQHAAPMQVKTEKVKNEGEQALRPAENVPQALADTLAAYFETQPNINKCYFMQTVRNNDTTPTLVAVVDFEGDMQQTFNGIATAARKTMQVNQSIGMMSIKDSVAAAAVLEAAPFYTKKG